MKSTTKIIAGLALTELLCACSGHNPVTTPASTTVVKPQAQVDRKIYYIPPTKLPGQWTEEDIGRANAIRNLVPYFAKAKVSYPPREVTLIALKQEMKLELWARGSGEFRFIRDYHIKAASGVAGPKLRQGDRQVPAGHVSPNRPVSQIQIL